MRGDEWQVESTWHKCPSDESAWGAVPGRDVGVQHPGDHPHCQLRLGREPHPVADPRLGATLGILGPGLGQVELAIQERAPGRGGAAEEDPDLTVFDPARGPGVLPCHAGGLGAL